MIRTLQRAVMERVYHLLYNQFAWSYDVVSWLVSLGHWRAWGRAALPYLPGPRVLELGHGPGHLLAALTNGQYAPVGVDLSPHMGRMARRRLERLGLPSRLTRGRAQALPFAAESFDGVVAAFPTLYIVAPETVDAVWRVLRPGGRLVIVPEAALTAEGTLPRLIEWLYRLTGQRSARQTAPEADSDVWRRALAGRGFAVEVMRVPQSQSVVTVIVATKENGPPAHGRHYETGDAMRQATTRSG